MDTPEIIARRLDGSPRERRELAKQILEYVDRAVHYALRAGMHASDQRADLVAEAMLYIYRDDAKIVRGWDPSRGGFRGYLSMVSSRYVYRRRGGRTAWTSLVDDPYAPTLNMEEELAYRGALEELHDWVMLRGSSKDRSRFESLVVQERLPAEVAQQEGGSTDSLYTWLSRFKRRAKAELPHLVELMDRRR